MRFRNIYPAFLSACLFLSCQLAFAQNELGILLNSEEAFPSYTLYDTFQDAFLIDNCGRLVHSWEGLGYISHHPKLLPNGNLIYINDRFTVRELDWDGNVVNEARHEDANLSIEYEVIVLPNENYLCVGRRNLNQQGFIDLGYNWDGTTSPNVTDVVVEMDRETGDILWEWNIKDHVIQQRDPDANNYGILSENPGLLNLDAISKADWNNHESFMINSMDYNPELDQIAISVRKMSEICIIDHSTTTEEAAGSTGGNSGRGGDILYRWGNPQNYGRGDSTDQQLFLQHNPNWITEGPHTGKIIVYDNGYFRPVDQGEPYSSVPIIELPTDGNGNYLLAADEPFEPADPTLRYSRPETNTQFFSAYTSGAEVLPNGNVYITEGVIGRLMELNAQGEVVWMYRVPYASYIYRTEKYPLDYPAFTGRDLMPGDADPLATSTYDCMLVSSTDAPADETVVTVFYQPTNEQIRVQQELGESLEWILYNAHGQLLAQGKSAAAQTDISLRGYPAGLYLVSLRGERTRYQMSRKIVKYH